MSLGLSFFLTLLPIAVVLVLLVVFRKSADFTGVIGWAVVSVVSVIFFKTSVEVVLRSSLAGLISSFSVSLIVATSLFQITVMQKTGALKRIIVFIKTISTENRAVSIMMVNIGFGILMVSVGATPVSILPPILLAMGYSAYSAIALPAIGYDSLCTYALLGAPIVVFVDVANKFLQDSGSAEVITLSDAGRIFSLFLPLVSMLIGFSMLWIVGKWQEVKKGFLPVIVTSTVIGVVGHFTNLVDNLVPLTGVICGISVILAMSLYLKITGKKIIDRSKLTEDDLKTEKEMPLWRALMPWILLTVIIISLNVPKPVFDYLYKTLTLPINGITADGSPIKTRALWNAYTWILVSTLLALPFLKLKKGAMKESLQTWLKRAPRPVFAAAVFFAIGSVMEKSGYDMTAGAQAADSMTQVLAKVSAQTMKEAFQFVSSFIGLLGGFISGSEASTIGMFGRYVLDSAKSMSFSLNVTILIAASLAFGGGLASVISPAKLQNASASIDKLGEETKVIKAMFVFALIFTLIAALFTSILIVTGVVS